MLVIRADLVDEMVAPARADHPDEACGVIAGPEGSDRPERFVAMARVLGVEDAREPMDFIRALEALQRACGVADLRMSDYGISPDEFPAMVRNARETMGFLFPFDREPLSDEECEAIYRASYR